MTDALPDNKKRAVPERAGLRRTLRGIALMVATSFRAAPALASGVFGFTAIASVIGPLGYAFIKRFADGVTRGNVRQVVVALVSMAVIEGVAWALNMYGIAILRMTMEERTRLYVERQILRLVGGLPGIEHHERPEYANEVELLRGSQGTLAQPVGPIVFLFQVVLMGGTTLAMLARVHPLLLALPLFGMPALVLAGIATKQRRIANEETIERQRLLYSVFSLATIGVAGKEMRIFGLGRELRRRVGGLQRDVLHVNTAVSVKGTLLNTLGSLIFATGYVGSVVFVARRALRGQATVGDVLLTVSLAGSVNGLVSSAVVNVRWLGNAMKVVSRYIWLFDYAATQGAPPPSPSRPPGAIEDGIRLEGVGFRYPGSTVDVLHDVSLALPAGSTVAIVGDNGAGKTTLVKLLCRFYEPTTGAITIDGVELSSIPIVEWRSRIAAGFQDFSKFEFIAQETVGVGDLPFVASADHVLDAAARAHATDVVDSLEAGLSTQLGRQFDDGVELSVGQWQKLALGRAMMRTVPLLLVLDEPTASLDAQTEHALFERYAAGASEVARSTGAITVLVSHRFSTVRMADLIVVVEGGRVTEVGSHADLVRAGRTYAELYNIQAAAYR